jgi:hypothetical protein
MRVCHTDISVAIDYSHRIFCALGNSNKNVEVHSLDSLLKKMRGR